MDSLLFETTVYMCATLASGIVREAFAQLSRSAVPFRGQMNSSCYHSTSSQKRGCGSERGPGNHPDTSWQGISIHFATSPILKRLKHLLFTAVLVNTIRRCSLAEYTYYMYYTYQVLRTYFIVCVFSACVICTLPHLGILLFLFVNIFFVALISRVAFFLLCSRTRYDST